MARSSPLAFLFLGFFSLRTSVLALVFLFGFFLMACGGRAGPERLYERSLLYKLPVSLGSGSPFFLPRGSSLNTNMVAMDESYFAYIHPEHNAIGLYDGERTVMVSNFDGVSLRYIRFLSRGLFGFGLSMSSNLQLEVWFFELPHKSKGKSYASPYMYEPIPLGVLQGSEELRLGGASSSVPLVRLFGLGDGRTILLWGRRLLRFRLGERTPRVGSFALPSPSKGEVLKGLSLGAANQFLLVYAFYVGKDYAGLRVKTYDHVEGEVVSQATLGDNQEHFFGFHDHRDVLSARFDEATRTIHFVRYLGPGFDEAEGRRLVLEGDYPSDLSASGAVLSGYVRSDDGLVFYTWR